MTQRVGEIMSDDIVSVGLADTVRTAAEAMRDHDVGDVLVTESHVVRGVVTDRDIAVRVVGAGLDPSNTTVREIKSGQLVSVRPDTPVTDAAELMREHAIRRLPVLDNHGGAVGMVTIGDIAESRDPQSALSDISSAPPNE